jgi:hypothetical protein
VAHGERPGIAGGLREADQEQARRGDHDRREVVLEHVERRKRRRGKPAGHMSDERHSVRTEVEQVGREQPADDEDERAGDTRREKAEPQDDPERDGSDDEGRPADVPEAAEPRGELCPRALARGRRPGQLGQLSDDDVDGGSGEETGDDRA